MNRLINILGGTQGTGAGVLPIAKCNSNYSVEFSIRALFAYFIGLVSITSLSCLSVVVGVGTSSNLSLPIILYSVGLFQ